MKKLILFFMLISSPIAYAGQIVCHEKGQITHYSESGNSQEGCLYYDPPHKQSQKEYDRVKNLFNSEPKRYIKILNNSPVEKSPQEKIDADDAMAQSIKNSEIARIEDLNVTGRELSDALTALVEESSTVLELKQKLSKPSLISKIKEQSGL